MILSIIIHLYFAVNIFIAGREYQRYSYEKLGLNEIIYYLVIIFFSCIFFIVKAVGRFSVTLVLPIYKRTWLNWAISTTQAWNKHIRKGEPTELYGNQLVQFRKNVMINKMPPFMRNVWFKIIDENLQKQRDELTSHGEVSDF